MKIRLLSIVILGVAACSDDGPREWTQDSVKIVSPSGLDKNTAQTRGMMREAAINAATAETNRLWVGKVTVPPKAMSAPHHHGATETVAYVLSGRSRTRFGNNLEFVAEAGPGDFVYIPPYCPHQEINAGTDEPLVGIVIHDNQTPVVVRLDVHGPEDHSGVHWVDHMHPHPE